MDKDTFERLLSRMEGDSLDFKEQMYKIEQEGKSFGDKDKKYFYELAKADLVKDILCMVNTPREEDAYIILGVRKHNDGTYDLLGLDKDIDPELLTSQFPPDRVYPIPRFSYSIVDYRGKKFGVISIPKKQSGPCVTIKDFPASQGGNTHTVLREQQVYWRRDSKNCLATAEEIHHITEWFRGILIDGISTPPSESAWDRFLDSTDGFHSAQRYILIAAPLDDASTKTEYLSAIGMHPWSMVLDFDPQSDTRGLLQAVKPVLEERRSLRPVILHERPPLNTDRATYWFYARGLQGISETVCLDPLRQWSNRYGREISEQLNAMASATDPFPVICVALWYNTSLISHLRSTLGKMMEAFQQRLRLLVVTRNPADIQSVCAESQVDALIDIPFHQFCSGLKSIAKTIDSEESICKLPSNSGATILLEPRIRQRLEEELELITLSNGEVPPFPEYARKDFLRGAEPEISWYGLDNGFDVERDRRWKLEDALKILLDRKRTVRHPQYYDAGAGGTTLARRVLWDLHEKYPCAILRHYSIDTVERLYTLAHLTGQSILLLIDGAQIAERQVEDLLIQLGSRQVPVVLFQTQRRFRNPNSVEERVEKKYLESKLSLVEARRFVVALSAEVPSKRARLEQLLLSSNPRECSPFYMGLETFEQDFRGITPYVSARLMDLTAIQQQIMVFLSLALHYAQSPIRAQAFASMVGMPRNRRVDLKEMLPTSACELLIEGQENNWQVIHDFIAQEILHQLLGFGQNKEQNWRQSLSRWAKDFAHFCRGKEEEIPGKEMLDLARSVFIYRNKTDFLGTEGSANEQFAHLIEDIPVDVGKIEVLKTIAECYSEDAHFKAHLGRFYAVKMQDFPQALIYLDRAIILNGKDHVLYHMKGVALRQQVYQLLDDKAPLNEIMNLVRQATECFLETRKLRPDASYGYISEIELLIRVLENVGRSQTDQSIFSYLNSANADPFMQECLDHANELLTLVRWMGEGEEPSSFEQKCRAHLDRLYSNYDKALQILDNLLHRPDTYHPSIRRDIIWTLLIRKTRNWEKLEPNAVTRIISLLEENMQEEPYNDNNLRLWMQAIRRATYPPSLDSIIERISYWRANSGALDAIYYLYVCNMIRVLEGSVIARDDAKRFMDECSDIARPLKNRTRPIEWLGHGNTYGGITKIVNLSELGGWVSNSSTGREFWQNTFKLVRVAGHITEYRGQQSGEIEVENTGISAFFVPARGAVVQATRIDAGDGERSVVYGGFDPSDVGASVTFYLGFSYDGLRAWEVTRN